jgi:hypothetical protein
MHAARYNEPHHLRFELTEHACLHYAYSEASYTSALLVKALHTRCVFLHMSVAAEVDSTFRIVVCGPELPHACVSL